MKLDQVHDIQKAYRKVVDSISRPGMITNLSEEAAKADFQTGCYPSTEVLALMLLDTEVSFKVFSEREEKITSMLNQLTYAKTAPADQADFVFILKDCDPTPAIQAAKTGSLNNPHESAILIIETESVSEGLELILKGPGIKTEHIVHIANADTWLDIRNEKNKEFPLGIDIILTNAKNDVLCLPRATQMRKRVTK